MRSQTATPLTTGTDGRPRDEDDPGLHDLRFRALLGAPAWLRLPAAIRQRFSRRLGAGAVLAYVGEVIESRRSRFGKLLSQLCRLIGAPLALYDDTGVPAVVTVTEDSTSGSQFWTRMYGRVNGFPQVIHSSKRFRGPTGLEEYLGYGFGIALRVSADTRAIHFHSDHYFVDVGGVRLRLPRWLEPGELTVSHVDRGDGCFAFVLRLRHARLGELLSQIGLFREHPPLSRLRRTGDPIQVRGLDRKRTNLHSYPILFRAIWRSSGSALCIGITSARHGRNCRN